MKLTFFVSITTYNIVIETKKVNFINMCSINEKSLSELNETFFFYHLLQSFNFFL